VTAYVTWPAEKVACITLSTFAVADWKTWLETPVSERAAFLDESKKRFDAAFDEALAARPEAVILDLRGNAGGTDLLGIHVAQRLIAEPFVYFRLSAKVDSNWTKPHGYTYQPRGPHLSVPVAALVDERVFSTADNFVRCLKDYRKDLVVIGRPTGAGTGAPSKIATLPHSGAVISLCTQRVYGGRSGLIEGVGTVPDVPVVWSRRDVMGGGDPDLEAALEALKRR
jgi:C-terminal processing protease CtpA/Prc